MQKLQAAQLQSIPLFSHIQPTDLDILIGCLQPSVRRYQKGEIAVATGDPLRMIGVVLDGEIEILHENAAGNKSLLALAGPGTTFGEVAAFAGQPFWPSTITAHSHALLMFLPHERFLGNCPNACGFHKTLIQNMLKIISQKALRLNRKVEYLEIKGIRQKLCTYLLEMRNLHKSSTFILPMNKNELADYLHVSRPSLSREFGKLRDEGALDFYMSSVRLLDEHAIQKAASE